MTSTPQIPVFPIINPATGEEIARHPGHSDTDVDRILGEVALARRDWSVVSFDARSDYLRAIAGRLRDAVARLARLMALEMGKPVAQGQAEIRKCADSCDYYAEHGASFLAPERLPLEQARIRYEPLGTVLAVMPWNYPFWQVFRAAGPVLMAGNAMVLKHASNVMGSAIEIENLMTQAGLPQNVFRTLRISASQVGRVIRHPEIRAVTLTGSEPAGKAVMAAAAAELKPCVLELGGSDPFIVLEDADLQEAVRVGAWARNQNAGQSCIAAKRFIVVDRVHDDFVSKLVEAAGALEVGDPLDSGTKLGPLAREDLRNELHDQVQRSVRSGARLCVGGEIPLRPGAFYAPTVLADVGPGVPVFDEETFGPVAAVVRVADEAEAVRMANRSRFGLGASVWTRDRERGDRIAGSIESGMVFVNSMTHSDWRMPFGGVKASGFGRELWVQGIRAFTNVKTVYIAAEDS